MVALPAYDLGDTKNTKIEALTTSLQLAIANTLAANVPALSGITYEDITISKLSKNKDYFNLCSADTAAQRAYTACPAPNATGTDPYVYFNVSLTNTEHLASGASQVPPTGEIISKALSDNLAEVFLHTPYDADESVGDVITSTTLNSLLDENLATASPAAAPDDDDDLSTGAIVGIVIGAVVVLGLIYMAWKRKSSGMKQDAEVSSLMGKLKARNAKVAPAGRVNWAPVNNKV